MADLTQLAEALERYVKPQTYPVAARMCSSEDELVERVRFPKRDLGFLMPACQLVSLARRYGYVMAMGVDDTQCPLAPIVLGLVPAKKRYLDGEFMAPALPSQEARARFARDLKRLPYGKYKYLLVAPIHRTAFKPDLVLVYCTPAQAARLAQGAVFLTGKAIASTASTGGTCSVLFASTMLSNEYQLTVPGAGDRNIALTQDHEVAFAIPAGRMDDLVAGLAESEKTGVYRLPIASWLRFEGAMPGGYQELWEYLKGEGE